MAKKELFRNWAFGWLLRAVNAHPIHRGFDRRAINIVMKLLESGDGLVVFPEGTRAKHGNFLPPRPGLGIVAVKCRVPIVPAYITGTNRLAACFFGKEEMRVIIGSPIDMETVSGYEDNKEGYRLLAENVMGRIGKLKKEYLNHAATA
jgi:1-acyl-sn-glycerol-3-phosphate acyltransferase